MADLSLVVNAHMSALVDRVGCQEAAAELLTVRWGHGVSKGTISRKLNGSLDWTLRDVIGIEDALREYPVTRTLERRRAARGIAGSRCGYSLAASIAKETGEALSAILAAEQSARAEDRAQAIKEIQEAEEALRQARVRLEAMT